MKKLYLILTTFVMVLLLIGCTNIPNYTIDDIEADISIGFAAGDDYEHVTQDMTLPTTSSFYTESFISWISDDPDVVGHNGDVTRTLQDVDVTLTYTIVYYDETRIGTITVTVLADRPSIEEIEDAIIIGFAGNDNANSITEDITLPTVSVLNENATIAWVSSNQSVINNDGEVTRPAADTLLTLTYTITYHDETLSASIFVIVLKADVYYTVIFDTQGGSSIQNVSILEDTVLDEPTEPTREGYTFVGWYSDSSFNNLYDFSSEVDADLTLYARWSLIEVYYTITFDTDGGNAIAPIVSSNLENPSAPTTPVKDGYTFKGWFTDQTYATQFYFNAPLTADLTLYAKWQENSTIDYTGIYDGAEGLSGSTLVNFLYNVVISDITGNEQDYGAARDTLQVTDRDTSNASNLILVYLGTSVNATWDSGITWNREHVWPQSLLGDSASNDTVNKASDLHNLKPANPSENSSRGNKWFGDSTTSTSYEPRDEVKGDIARILFYMAVRYYSELTLVNLSGSQEPSTYQMGDLATLLIWNAQDPVDAFEMNRNDMIEGYQGNRNPFIDYPEFADLIWG